jgi:hypothetical protein
MRMVRYFVQVCKNGDANGDANGDDSKGLELGLGILIEQM